MQTAKYADETPKYSITYNEKGEKHGPELWWHPNGQLKFQGENVNGIRHGRYSAWYPNGRMWYRGHADHGRKDSVLTYWHPNGELRAVMTYEDGRLVSTVEYDLHGRRKLTPEEQKARREQFRRDSLARAHESGMKLWTLRVRKSVESYWRPPSGTAVREKAVAKITVRRDGKILRTRLVEQSENRAFNRAALKTFDKIRSFPPLPEHVEEGTLDIQYEFLPPKAEGLRHRVRGEE